MDRLLSLEPTNEVAISIEPGQRCFGKLTLRNVMYTMPVAFRLQPLNRSRYFIKPQSGIIPPLAALTIEITYVLSTNSCFQEQLPHSTDTFLLDSIVVPGASFKDSLDSVPQDWFTTRKKQVFTDSGIKVFFIGSGVLTKLVAEGSMDQIREVLERSNPEWHAADSTDSLGQSLLHIAISQCRADIVQLLLEFDPNVEACNKDGRTPLEAAAAAGEALIVELLLAHGASTEKLSTSAWGSVHFAAAGDHLDVMQLLLQKGADVNLLTKEGLSALHLSVQEHRYDCARLLIVSGARADIRGGAEGDTPLHIAASSGNEHMVNLLLSKGRAGLKEVRNLAGKTAYDAAVEGGHGRLFDVLKLGTELALAAKKGDMAAVEKMVEKGALVNGRDQHGWTALMRAGFKGKIEVMKGLLERGAVIDASDEEGYTVLHCAVGAGQVEVVEMLVKRGADLEVKTKKGASAMQIANSLGYAGIIRILAQGGATVIDGEENVSALEKKQVRMSSRSKGKRIHDNEVRKIGGKLSFVSGFDRMVMAVASH